MNRLEAMTVFVRVAELGSFAAAATQMGLARSVVTRQIAALEEHLGVKLMVRSTRRLMLTAEGAAYLDKCRSILEMVEVAEAGVMEDRLTPRGRLRLSLPLSYSLKRLVPELIAFSNHYPDIAMAMDFTDRKVNLIEEGFDLSIRITPTLEAGDIARKLGTARLITIASPAYLARAGRPRHPKDLAKHACLGYSPAGASPRPWSYRIKGEVQPFHLPFHMHANNGEALTEAAAAGLGITMQPDFIVKDYLESGRVEEILKTFAPPELGIYAVLPTNRYLPHRVRLLLEWLAERLKRK